MYSYRKTYSFKLIACLWEGLVGATVHQHAIIRIGLLFFFQVPNNEDEWLEVAKGFRDRWNFPNCVGALDGKHVVIIKPSRSGSTFLNYKNTFSIVLMAIVDADYKFVYVNVGAQGRISDGGVFNQCKFAESLNTNTLGLPQPDVLPSSELRTPYVLVADEAFPLTTAIMKPFPRRGLAKHERVFNYRLSRARRVVENAFGILSAKFRVFRSPIALKVSTVRKIVLATTCLHNFLRKSTNERDENEFMDSVDFEDTESATMNEGSWRTQHEEGGLRSLPLSGSGRMSKNAKEQRLQLAKYFVGSGSVPWQWRSVGVTIVCV